MVSGRKLIVTNPSTLQRSNRQAFCVKDQCDLDLWRDNFNIKRDRPLGMTNLPAMFKYCASVFQSSLGQVFCVKGHGDLDLYHDDPRLVSE